MRFSNKFFLVNVFPHVFFFFHYYSATLSNRWSDNIILLLPFLYTMNSLLLYLPTFLIKAIMKSHLIPPLVSVLIRVLVL